MPRRKNEDIRREQLLELKGVLTEKRNSIVKHMKKIEEDSSKSINDVSGDDVDVANLEWSQRTSTRIGNRERRLLKKIEIALDKFGEGEDTGMYGICELSGEDIPIKRLQARPEAQYTVEAKEELERKEGTFRDPNVEDEVSLGDD